MILILLVVATLLCGLQALRARQLLSCALWLAAVSALVAITFYHLGAPQAAAIELSVGAGLITVLFVFAISLAVEAGVVARPLLPRPLAAGLVILAVVLLGWFILRPAEPAAPTAEAATFAEVMWQQRSLDVPVQVVLIFSGVLGVLGLLAEPAPEAAKAPTATVLVRRHSFSPTTPLVYRNGFGRPTPKPNPEPADPEKVPL